MDPRLHDELDLKHDKSNDDNDNTAENQNSELFTFESPKVAILHVRLDTDLTKSDKTNRLESIN